MFDASSRRLLKEAPELPGLNPEILDELLTEAHVVLATARVQAREGEDLVATLDRVRRLAATFEAYVALGLQPEQTRASAFVAASAHQIIAQAFERRQDLPTLLTSDAIDATISSTLLFLIAERTADAAEAARQLRAKGEESAIRRSLILSVREFARSELNKLVDRDLNADRIITDDSRETATDLLYRECSRALQMLANEALGGAHAGEVDDAAVPNLLDQVIELSISTDEATPEVLTGPLHMQFAGPHHLAKLMSRLVGSVRASMLVRTPVPKGANSNEWTEWLATQSRSRPFLWSNHQNAISTGYLDCGQSMVMTSPTGSGKTTLSVLKIAATRCASKSVVYLAPTHALCDQVETDLSDEVGYLDPKSVEDLELLELGERLPPLSVMTPERCLALLGAAPELFENVGLLVFDEFHLIGASQAEKLTSADGRSIDAMLALMTFLVRRPDADLLLLSAMVSNGEQIKEWLISITGREVEAFNDPWKPTRQLRSCAIYDSKEIFESATTAMKEGSKFVPARPYGLFSLIAGWHPQRPEKLAIRPLSEATPPLTLNKRNDLTSNRNIVAAQIAADFAGIGKRVIVFCQDTRGCGSIADSVDSLLEPADTSLDDHQSALMEAILADVGSVEAAFLPAGRRAAVHNGDLLPTERHLVESVFRAHGRAASAALCLNVIAATSTIAQGLNLPCDVVILAGTDRSVEDDPDGNPRKDLKPHEILNALGRAGRAAYAATGIAVVIPAKVIAVDLTDVNFASEQAPLPVVFSDQDACDVVHDPVALLLDHIETDVETDPRTQAMIRRLRAVTEDGTTGFDAVAKSSLGYYVRKTDSKVAADAWLEARRQALEAAAYRLTDPPVTDWQHEMAVRNGVPPALVEHLHMSAPNAPLTATKTSEWISWLLDTTVQSSQDLLLLIRPNSLDTVFGRAWKDHPDPDAAVGPVIGAIKTMVEMWCSGKSLVDIQTFIHGFVIANEIKKKRPAPNSSTAQRARRFAIRILPDIGFVCSLLGQVFERRELEDGTAPPEIVPMLQRLVKVGDHDRHHSILRHETGSKSRVLSFHECEQMRENFSAGPMDPIEVVQSEVRTGIAMRAFADIDDADPS
ncbi:DEAD/DEAH box helicase [Ruegeria sp. HU-ET01832]|uniref:DEAD/DEAH box helicase n=1 Tax=Ruegeria sp. HU-ET01832 TaxID=3135906 RepID=UPI0033402790